MQLAVSQLAQANEQYLIVSAGHTGNGLFDSPPFVGGVTSALLPTLRQSIVVPAEENYRYALHVWQASLVPQQ